MANSGTKPTTHQGNFAKLPRALAPLIARPQWAVWRWTQLPNGKWQKPPFMATQPSRHASTKDPGTWTDYATALAAAQAGHGDGISYILTEADPYAAIDLDNCRHLDTHSIDVWAQNFLEAGRNSYSEVTPSGSGVRIWGLADGTTLNKKFTLNIDGKDIAAELFRRTNKALTVTGCRLDTIRALANIDRVIDWAIVWGERRKAAAAPAPAANGFNGGGNGCGYSVDQIEHIVRAGVPDGANRSNLFHTIVGHYLGCDWDPEQILAHLQQYPDGIGARYIAEGRLANEVIRSARKYGVTAPAETPAVRKPVESDPELQDDKDPEDDEDDLDDEDPQGDETKPKYPPRTLAEVHDVFRKWFGPEYDTDTIDAVLATAAAEHLAGDPLWLLVISGPGNTKTETVQSLSGAGAFVTSTIASEGALLSASPHKSRIKTATGGLLRRLGDRGILVIKDVTSILSADRNTRAGVLAALREVYDGRWERNVGTDGGQTLTWTGRIAVVGAVTTAWDVAHSVVSVMGDRFVLLRSNSTVGRSKAGTQAIRNTGGEVAMRPDRRRRRRPYWPH